MPKSPKKQCSSPGCHNISQPGRSKCKPCEHSYEQERGTACQRLYDYKWQKASRAFLKKNPLCIKCFNQGFVVRAKVTDHIIPHKGDMQLFWDKKNWQPMCIPCHNTKTATEDGGFGRARQSK